MNQPTDNATSISLVLAGSGGSGVITAGNMLLAAAAKAGRGRFGYGQGQSNGDRHIGGGAPGRQNVATDQGRPGLIHRDAAEKPSDKPDGTTLTFVFFSFLKRIEGFQINLIQWIRRTGPQHQQS